MAITAQSSVAELAKAARQTNARLAVIGDPELYGELKGLLAGTATRSPPGPLPSLPPPREPADCVLAAIVGAAGLEPTFEAARQGRRLALANKECLVSAGEVFMSAVAEAGTELLPVDSEHSAALQALAGAEPESIETIVLTASGGPFRTWSAERLARATPAEALRHPNWSMGAKITHQFRHAHEQGPGADRGLSSVSRARRPARHRRAPAVDRALPRQLHRRLGAGAALIARHAHADCARAFLAPTHGDADTAARISSRSEASPSRLPTRCAFPRSGSRREALRSGGAAPAVLNAANEIAVEAFLKGAIGFCAIADVTAATLEAAGARGLMAPAAGLTDILAVDAEARRLAQSLLSRYV